MTLSPQTIQTIKATAPAVAQHAEAITRRFYSLMFTANPEVKAFFNQAHQHSGGQQKALAGAICAFAVNIDNLAVLGPAVELIAQKHCSLGVQAEHYPIVGKHLLAAIQDILGPAATPEILGAWGQAYGLLADILIAREAQIYQEQASTPHGWNGYRKFIVDRKTPENHFITSFYLKPADNTPLPAFKPGQYLTLKIDHPACPTSPRNYSLSDRPGTGYYRISVKRESAQAQNAPDGMVSTFLHDHIQPGDTLNVGPACGEFTLDPQQSHTTPIVLISAGIGITPLLSMLKSLAHHRASTPIYFIHAARNSTTHALSDEVRTIAAASPNIKTHFIYDAPLPGDLESKKCDSTGAIDHSLLSRLLPAQPCQYYFCGPKPFMANLYRILKTSGVPESHIHFEFFGPKQDITAPALATV
jgi:nitric oxide dioxygenase